MSKESTGDPLRGDGVGWDDLYGDAVRVLTQAARWRRPPRVADRVVAEGMDFAEFVSLVLTATAANVGGIEELLAGRSGSWEASYLRDLLTSTAGMDGEFLADFRTEPAVPVDSAAPFGVGGEGS